MLGLKGVSKSVIELQVADNAYFERAVFYLKPNCNGVPVRALHREAQRWVGEILPQQKQVSVSGGKLLAVIIASGAFGAGICAAMFWLMQAA